MRTIEDTVWRTRSIGPYQDFVFLQYFPMIQGDEEYRAMPDKKEARGEQPSTYMVQDRSNREELTRLHLQDQMLTAGMGGVLPEQADPARFQNVLDVACGTGGWLIEVARAYPAISRLVGVDISARM